MRGIGRGKLREQSRGRIEEESGGLVGGRRLEEGKDRGGSED